VWTPFFGPCQSIGKATDGEWVDTGPERKRMETLGLWARMSVAADGSKEGASEVKSASYLLDFIIVCLGLFS